MDRRPCLQYTSISHQYTIRLLYPVSLLWLHIKCFQHLKLVTLNSISETCRFKGSRGSDIGDARQLCTPNNPNPVSIGGQTVHAYMLTPNLWPFEKGLVSSNFGDPLIVTKRQEAWLLLQFCEWCGNSLSLSLSLMRMEHISMTLVSHKMCE